MSMEFVYQSTGHDLVDSMQGLQKVADGISDIESKIIQVRRTLGILSASALIQKKFIVNSWQLFAKHIDKAPDYRMLVDQELKFVGSLESYKYLLDEKIPVDALVLNFANPEVVGGEPEINKACRALTFQVPILAIKSCMEVA